MILKELKPQKALNKAFLKVKPNRTEIERFKTNLITLLDRTNDFESEEFHKNLIRDFLHKTYYEPTHFINTKGRYDLVIHNGPNADSTVGVIIEAKKPTNKTEIPMVFANTKIFEQTGEQMITTRRLNSKAFQELVLYYLRERITHKNLEVKHLVATNINEWFIFDEHLFERLFAQNKWFVRQFENFEASRKSTDVFYKEIAEPYIDSISSEIEFTYINIRDFQKPIRNADKADDNSLIALFKLLSPEHLLKLPFINDSNSLDKRFYSELLHIIGLTETKEGSKKLIERNKPGERNSGTILEDAIIQLDSLDKIRRLEKPSQFGNTQEERLFNVALELSITWINRILFLKLLEAQLLTYHKGDKSYSFLSFDKINNYDDLNSLFFQVLARKYDERNEDVKKAFEKVPYLNSSLFEPTDIEQVTLFISNLKDDKTIPFFSQTVLKDQQGKKRTGHISTLQYLFEFLDAYDFGAEGGSAIQEDNKTLINASVLGLIFEKINGYKDGSFFTPGFITMYMCRETIRKAVVEKFNEYCISPLSRGAGGVSTPLLRGAGGVSSHTEDTFDGHLPNPPQGGKHLPNPPQGGKHLPDPPQGGSAPLLRGAGGVSSPLSKRIDDESKRTIIPYNPKLKELARALRNNSTKSEIILWNRLKGKYAGKYDFHRQKPLDEYIADFFCHELSLVIEVDGSSHNLEEVQAKDKVKEARFNELGLNVLRFSDDNVFHDLDGVLEIIWLYVQGFEKGDLSELVFEGSPLNAYMGKEENTPPAPLERGVETLAAMEENTPPTPLKRGEEGQYLFRTIDDIYEQIGEGRLISRKKANEIINSLKICDPAVGSGHFLVSALNEIIAIKNDLKVLEDRDGKSLHRYEIEVVNDELIVTDEDGELFEYKPGNKESQRIQETLFHEKQTIIENCLFGVDINTNSVKICRLRLWIELLKNAYYKHLPSPPQGGKEKHLPDPPQGGSAPLSRGAGGVSSPLSRGAGGVLETLPNIDINIKCGNSLVSRFAIDADLREALKKSKWTIDQYRIAVKTYQNAENKEQKREMEQLIADIKSDFRSEISHNDVKVKKLRKLSGELFQLTNQQRLFEMSPKEKADWNKKVQQLTEEIKKIETEIEEIKANKIFENAFEWRFEFPEVLNDEGDFVGFDVVIGNPPYGVKLIDIEKEYLKNRFTATRGEVEIYTFFIELAMADLLKQNGIFSYITTNTIYYLDKFSHIRKKAFLGNRIISLLELEKQVFADAPDIVPAIYVLQKIAIDNNVIKLYKSTETKRVYDLVEFEGFKVNSIEQNKFETKTDFVFSLSTNKEKENLLKRISQLDPVNKSFKVVYGIKTGDNERFISKEANGTENWKKCASSAKNIKKYTIDWQGDYLNVCKDLAGLNNINYEQPKILVQYIRKLSMPVRLVCALDVNGEYYPLNNFSFIISENANSLRSLLGIFNSRLMNWYFSNCFVDYNIKPKYIEQLPLPTNINSHELEAKVAEIITLKAKDKEIDTSDLENQIDHLVYQLYGLTEEEIKIIENN